MPQTEPGHSLDYLVLLLMHSSSVCGGGNRNSHGSSFARAPARWSCVGIPSEARDSVRKERHATRMDVDHSGAVYQDLDHLTVFIQLDLFRETVVFCDRLSAGRSLIALTMV